MYERVLIRIRKAVKELDYVVTKHARAELEEDNLIIHDLEQVLLTGHIIERQKDRNTGEQKYRIRCKLSECEVEVIVKISIAGYPVVITIYCL